VLAERERWSRRRHQHTQGRTCNCTCQEETVRSPTLHRREVFGDDSLACDMEEGPLKPTQDAHSDKHLHRRRDCSGNGKCKQHSSACDIRYSSPDNLLHVNISRTHDVPQPPLTLAIGLHTNALIPIASINPAVEKVTTWLVVFKSSLISLLADNSDVLEKHAASEAQLHANTIRHFLHSGILSYNIEARVSTRSSTFSGCATRASAVSGWPKGKGSAFSASMEEDMM